MLGEKLFPAMGGMPGQMGDMNPQMMQMMGKGGPMGGQMIGKGGPAPFSAQTGPGAPLTAA
eukprot:592627-Heterocapsa_arctica.AAC.1